MSASIDSHLKELIHDYSVLANKYPSAFVDGECRVEQMSSDDGALWVETLSDIDLALEDENDEFQQGVGLILDAVLVPAERDGCVFERRDDEYRMGVHGIDVSETLAGDADPEFIWNRWMNFIITNGQE